MKRHLKRGDKKRRYTGEDQAGFLVQWLNSSDSKDAPNRRSNALAKKQIADILDGLFRIGTTTDFNEGREIAAAINKMFAKCALIPQVEINVWQPLPLPSEQQMACSLNYRPAAGTLHHSEMAEIEKSTGREIAWPRAHDAFMLLFDIWRDGHISKIRRCEHCKKFLFMRKLDQRWCGDRCREAVYKEKPEIINRRNEQRRDRYRTDKRRSAMHIQLARKGL